MSMNDLCRFVYEFLQNSDMFMKLLIETEGEKKKNTHESFFFRFFKLIVYFLPGLKKKVRKFGWIFEIFEIVINYGWWIYTCKNLRTRYSNPINKR